MKRITVLYDGTIYTFRWLSALLASKKYFANAGYKICIPGFMHSIRNTRTFDQLIKQVSEDDIVFLAFHPGGSYFTRKHEMLDFLDELHGKCGKIVWLDTSDSAGTTYFEVLPFVDKYLKKQLYVDLSLYNKDLCRDRLFCEYYSKQANAIVTEEDSPCNLKILDEDLEKLGISWNVGLGLLFERNKYRFLLNINRQKDYTVFMEPSLKKQYDIFYRGSIYNSITGYQRKLAIDAIQKLSCTHPDPKQRVSQKEYDKEILESKTILSPFGWGEICTRDFETFKNGAVLIKPNMSHLVTYPNFFIEDNTYIAINWDFDDLNARLEDVLNDNEQYYRIANNAQSMYKKALSEEGKKDFACHVLKEIGER